MEVTIVQWSKLGAFDNWSGSFWSQYKNEIDIAIKMEKDEMVDFNVNILTNFTYVIKNNIYQLIDKVKKDGSFTSSLVLRLKTAVDLIDDENGLKMAILGNGDMQRLRQLTVLMIYIKNNLIAVEYKKLQETLEKTLQEMKKLESLCNF